MTRALVAEQRVPRVARNDVRTDRSMEQACLPSRDPASSRLFSWEFRRGPATLPLKSGGRLVLTDVGTMLEACLVGAGIAQVLALGIAESSKSGRLIILFPDRPDETFPLTPLPHRGTPRPRRSGPSSISAVSPARRKESQSA